MTLPTELDYSQRFVRQVTQNAAAWLADVHRQLDDPAALDHHLDNLTRAAELALATPQAQHTALELVQATWRHAELRGHWQAWHQWIEQGVQVAEQAGLTLPQARLLDQLGECERLLGNLHAALACFAQAEALARQAVSPALAARALAHASQPHLELNDLDAAEACCRQAAALDLAEASANDLGMVYNNWGMVCRVRLQWQQALAHYTDAERYFNEAYNRRGQANVANNRGEVYRAQGDYPQAEACYRAALEAYRHLGDLGHEMSTLNNLSVALLEQERLDEALALNVAGEALARQLRQPQMLARLLNNRGLMRARQGAYHEAALLLEEAVAQRIYHGRLELGINSLQNLCDVWLDCGEPSAATEALSRSRSLMAQLSALPAWLSEDDARLAARLASHAPGAQPPA